MRDISFARPEYLFLLLLLIPLIALYIYRIHNQFPTLSFSFIARFGREGKSWKTRMKHVPFVLSMLAAICLILVIARPQSSNRWKDSTTEGIDIVIALDISGSMLAQDFQPDRLEAAKNVASEFISGRRNDRIGLVIFSAESFSQCPLTTDHAVLLNLFRNIKSGMLEDGTAIGLGLANAVSRLKESNAQSKVVILLTDGMNNAGEIDPLTAAEIASSFGIRVYTIGVGTMGMAPYPVQTVFGTRMQYVPVEIDEKVLQEVASMTGGKYWRATDNEKLRDIYQEIDRLEKSIVEVREYSKKEEEYQWFAVSSALLLLAAWFVKSIILRSIP